LFCENFEDFILKVLIGAAAVSLMLRPPHSRYDKIINSVMWRNIIGHAIYQIAVLMTILFWGVQLFGLAAYDDAEPFFVTKYWAQQNVNNANTVLSNLANTAISTNTFDTPTAKCVLYTMVFQTFVMMTIFNIINARKLGDREFNVFHSFFNNFRFQLIFVLIFVGQMWMVANGGAVVRTSGLSTNQNLICIAFGVGSLIWALVIKAIIPARWFKHLSIIDEREMSQEEVQASFVTMARRSFRESLRHGIENRVSEA